MSEDRLERIETHMVQLIEMVAENNKVTQELSQRFDGLEVDFKAEQELNNKRHHEVIKEIRNHHYEIDYLVQKVAQHDMEIHKLKESV